VPGNGLRYIRSATGVDAVLVNGAVVYADGAYTDARPGAICN
jgi:N-acyl-D-aspartate/D-glutamate deacylase